MHVFGQMFSEQVSVCVAGEVGSCLYIPFSAFLFTVCGEK